MRNEEISARKKMRMTRGSRCVQWAWSQRTPARTKHRFAAGSARGPLPGDARPPRRSKQFQGNLPKNQKIAQKSRKIQAAWAR